MYQIISTIKQIGIILPSMSPSLNLIPSVTTKEQHQKSNVASHLASIFLFVTYLQIVRIFLYYIIFSIYELCLTELWVHHIRGCARDLLSSVAPVPENNYCENGVTKWCDNTNNYAKQPFGIACGYQIKTTMVVCYKLRESDPVCNGRSPDYPVCYQDYYSKNE